MTQLKQFMMICIEAVKGKKISDITVLPDVLHQCAQSLLDCQEHCGCHGGDERLD